MKRTKIVATLGPASSSLETIGQLIDRGVNVFRLNFSHGTHADHAQTIVYARQAAAERQAPTAILQDLCGPKIRTGAIALDGLFLYDLERIALCASDDMDLGRVLAKARDITTVIPIDMAGFADRLDPGARVYINDGIIRLGVEAVEAPMVVCRVLSGGRVTSRKGVNLPGGAGRIDAITSKDLIDLKMGLEHGVDFVALSFVRSADDIHRLRGHMRDMGRVVPIIAKVEKAEAVEAMDAIVDAADGVMVARGDLGIEVNIEETPLIQKRLIQACRAHGKPVITATQMLESMVENPIPTRAEVSDVANAILDGTDALMLSQETAIGKRPADVVSMMALIARRVEASANWTEPTATLRAMKDGREFPDMADALSRAACDIADNLGARGIVACTMSGSTARRIARYRPNHIIYVVTPSEDTWRQMSLVWGAWPIRIGLHEHDSTMIREAVKAAIKETTSSDPNDLYVLTAGLPMKVYGITNDLRVVAAKDVEQDTDEYRMEPIQ